MAAPTIVMIPGCWHGPEAFDQLRSLLDPEYETTSAKLPSVGAENPGDVGLAEDVHFVRQDMIMPLLDQGKDVVILMHSYSAVPGSMAVDGLDRASRGSEKGAVVGLIYVASFLIPEGSSMFSWLGANRGNAADSYCFISDDATYFKTRNAVEYFYHDVPAREAQKHEALLQTHTSRSLADTVTYSAWSKDEWRPVCRYIYTQQDRILPLEFQRSFAGSMLTTGQIDSSHSPFLSRPEDLRSAVVRAMEDFVD